MPNPDYRRDKALEDIAKHLGDISKSLKVLAKNSGSTTTVFNSLQDQTRPDAFDVPQEPQPTSPQQDGPREPSGPTFPKSDNPYFKQRRPDDNNPGGSLGYEGPYGDGNGIPYS